jgi:hypothetical protein
MLSTPVLKSAWFETCDLFNRVCQMCEISHANVREGGSKTSSDILREERIVGFYRFTSVSQAAIADSTVVFRSFRVAPSCARMANPFITVE